MASSPCLNVVWEQTAEMEPEPLWLCPVALMRISFQSLCQAGPWTVAQVAHVE